MLTKNTIKYLQSLRQKKYRQKYNNFVAEGDKMAMEIIQSTRFSIEGIYALATWIDQQTSFTEAHRSMLHPISSKDLSRISYLKTPNQVFVVCKKPSYELDLAQINASLTLFLENIQDPGNLGTILRIADWFGLEYVFCSPNCVDGFSPKVIQASMGAFLRVKIYTIEFEDLSRQVSDLPIIATTMGGQNIFRQKNLNKGIVVIGNEGAGISSDVLQKSTHKLSIPRGKKGRAESLNAAVATGIICAALLASK